MPRSSCRMYDLICEPAHGTVSTALLWGRRRDRGRLMRHHVSRIRSSAVFAVLLASTSPGTAIGPSDAEAKVVRGACSPAAGSRHVPRQQHGRALQAAGLRLILRTATEQEGCSCTR